MALNAASNHDGTLYCVAGSCVNGTFRASDGQSLSVVGGTSVATPEFAGVLALVEQKIGSRIGNAGPRLYALANSSFYTSIFNDITTGNNTSPCTAGTINCPAGGVLGYSATVGYDQATGWGSINAANLANDWNSNQVTPIPPPTIGQSSPLLHCLPRALSAADQRPAGSEHQCCQRRQAPTSRPALFNSWWITSSRIAHYSLERLHDLQL